MENDASFDDEEDIEIISKSQQKRESQEITKLGKRLVELSATQLAELPIDEPVREAIALAHKIQNKRAALKRHYLFLGKLLRARDTDEIFAAVERFDNASQIEIQRHHAAERWRDKILDQGLEAIERFVQELTKSAQINADRQHLRQLWRNYNSAKTDAKKLQHARLIYKDIKRLLDSNAA